MLKRLVVLAVCAPVVSGCAISGTELHPGVAVQVGEDSVSVAKIDRLTREVCLAYADQLPGPLPMSDLASDVATLQITRLAIDQLAEKYDLEAGEGYRTQAALVEQDALTRPEGGRDAYIELNGDSVYIADILVQIGAIELDAVDDAKVEDQQKFDAGQKVLATYFAESDLRIDPRYGIQFDEGQLGPVDGHVSFAVSDLAKAGLAVTAGDAEADPTYVAQLTDAATCD